jgi:hypothetical protein
MKAEMWIDTEDSFMELPEGSPGFMIEISPQGKENRFVLQSDPGRTNMSHEAKLFGWLGETNNVSRTAHGLWKVIDGSITGSRVKVGRVTDRAEIEKFLELVGWPELIEQV